MTYAAEPAWYDTVDVDFSDDIAFDGVATHETMNDNKQSSGTTTNVAEPNE